MKLIKFYVIFLIIVFLSGCSFDLNTEYEGDYPELYTIACNSLITNGEFTDAEYSDTVRIYVLETDAYGRKLFAYIDNDHYSDHMPYYTERISFLISQFSDNEYVYYYPYYNFICYHEYVDAHMVNEKNIMSYYQKVSNNEINQLKECNDWNKPINENNCVKSKITNLYDRHFRKYSYIKKYKNIYTELLGYSIENMYGYVISEDYYGNKLLFIQEYHDKSYIIIVSKSWKYNDKSKLIYEDFKEGNEFYLPYTDNFTFQEQLAEFKKNNYWNTKSLDDVLKD